jgi:hypothetical protein
MNDVSWYYENSTGTNTLEADSMNLSFCEKYTQTINIKNYSIHSCESEITKFPFIKTPEQPIVTIPTFICIGDTLVLTAEKEQEYGNSLNYYNQWYNDTLGVIQNQDILIVPDYTENKEYYVRSKKYYYQSGFGTIMCPSDYVHVQKDIDIVNKPSFSNSSECVETGGSVYDIANINYIVYWNDQINYTVLTGNPLSVDTSFVSSTYKVSAKNQFGCWSPDTTINIIRKPLTPALLYPDTICKYDDVELISSHEQGIYKYSIWYDVSMNIISYDDTLKINNILQNESYYLKIVDSLPHYSGINNCPCLCYSNLKGKLLKVDIVSVPQVEKKEKYCSYDDVIVNVSNNSTNNTAMWYRNNNLQGITDTINLGKMNNSRIYNVKYQDSLLCISDKYYFKVVIDTLEADFSSVLTGVDEGTSVHFVNSSINNSQTDYWTFGDGGYSTAISPYHYYYKNESNNSYDVRLVISNETGCRDTLLKSN